MFNQMVLIFILGSLISAFFSSHLVLNKNASYKLLVSEKYLLNDYKSKLDEESVYLKNKILNLTSHNSVKEKTVDEYGMILPDSVIFIQGEQK
tara:strand:+ start:1549 stop:1827 length:279 start_codon:yes stop_codon:yes gene_type:complete